MVEQGGVEEDEEVVGNPEEVVPVETGRARTELDKSRVGMPRL